MPLHSAMHGLSGTCAFTWTNLTNKAATSIEALVGTVPQRTFDRAENNRDCNRICPIRCHCILPCMGSLEHVHLPGPTSPTRPLPRSRHSSAPFPSERSIAQKIIEIVTAFVQFDAIAFCHAWALWNMCIYLDQPHQQGRYLDRGTRRHRSPANVRSRRK